MDTEQPNPPSDETLSSALECLLFMADRPLSPKELGEMLALEPAQVCDLADRLIGAYDGRGVEIVRVAGGYQMCTRPEYSEYVAKLHEPNRFRLSRPAMETLAIIAYRQPVTRPEMEAVRGVNCDSVIETLLGRGLICERGRRHTPGRPMTYGTTPDFLAQFGLDSLRDLPDLPELTAEEVEARLRAEGLAPDPSAPHEGAAAEGVEPTPDGGAAEEQPPEPTAQDAPATQPGD